MRRLNNIFGFGIVCTLALVLNSCNASGPQFASKESMLEKCQYLRGLDRLIINQTTIDDIYQIFKLEQVEEDMGWRPNIDSYYNNSYNRICETAHWRAFTINDYNKDFNNNDIELDFYKDTLVQISFRYKSDSEKLPEYFIEKYGLGIPVTKTFLDSLHVGYSSLFHDAVSYRGHGGYRRYQNGDINIVVSDEYWDVVILHAPKFYQLAKEIQDARFSTSSSKGSSTTPRGHNSMDANDKEYWESVNREQALKDAGYKDAARLERQARQKYLQGGGYTSKDGGSQVHYQGSKEQQEHLEEMSRRGW